MKTVHWIQVVLGLSVLSLAACDPAADTSRVAGSKETRQERVYEAPPPPPRCDNCGTITDIQEVKEKGDASGIGAVIGAAAGAVVGHQVGDGRGQDAATAAGAIGGGITGHQIEKRINGTTYYNVTVSMENGGTQTAKVGALNGLGVGSKVKVVGNDLQVAG